MTLDTAYMITALVTMFVVIDPIAIAPVFLALTRGMSNAQRRLIAWRAVGVAGLVLLIFANWTMFMMSSMNVVISVNSGFMVCMFALFMASYTLC